MKPLPVREGEPSMKKEEINGKLKSVFQKVLEENDITITREMTAEDIEKWDSLHQPYPTDQRGGKGLWYQI